MRIATRGFLHLSLVACSCLPACADDDPKRAEITEEQQLAPCNPLVAESISLGTIFAAGKDAAGTLYLVDSPPDYRAFVSDGDDLLRQYISGFGQDGENDFIFDILEHDPAFALKVETGNPLRMGVVFGTPPEKMFQVGEVGEELVLVDDAEVKSKNLINDPEAISVAYSGTLPDQRWIVVTLPRDAKSSDEHRLFLGESTHISERTVTGFTQGLSMYAPRMIEFELDGELTKLTIAVTPPGSPPQASTLTSPTGSNMTLLAAPPPSGASYLCISE